MLPPMILALALDACNSNMTQTDLNVCWTNQANQELADLKARYAAVVAEMKKLGIDSSALAASQSDWTAMSDKTCAFEASLYEGGTIQPMEAALCYDRIAKARAQQLTALAATLRGNGALPPLTPVSATSDAELNRVYDLFLKQSLTAPSRKALVTSELAWISYRDAACKVAGGTCLTALTQERTAELEAGWIGDAFW
jgi:uncharacterized protein YecT (DUF1311 family)